MARDPMGWKSGTDLAIMVSMITNATLVLFFVGLAIYGFRKIKEAR